MRDSDAVPAAVAPCLSSLAVLLSDLNVPTDASRNADGQSNPESGVLETSVVFQASMRKCLMTPCCITLEPEPEPEATPVKVLCSETSLHQALLTLASLLRGSGAPRHVIDLRNKPQPKYMCV